MPAFFRRTRRRRSVIIAATVAAAAAVSLAPQIGANATATSHPSGEAPPTAHWWQPAWIDDFDGTAINNASWAVYNSKHTHDPRGQKLASNVLVHDGEATLRTTKLNGVWTTAGMCSAKATTGTYGKYLVRARFDHGYGVKAVALLWPEGNTWPPEVDFMEYDARDADHSKLMLTNHFRPQNSMQQAFVPGDYTQWHTFGVVWRPDLLKYTIDGKVVATMAGHIPTKNMWLGLQTAIGRQEKPNSSTPATVNLDVDWVAYYTAPASANWTAAH
jgi:beta-glucanase (GH16 family)